MSKPSTIFEVRKWASLFLEEHQREKGVAELLLQHHLGMTRVQLMANARDEVDRQVVDKLRKDLELHVSSGMPVQHLIGREEFYGRSFEVNSHVLIPRPETEELIVGVLDRLQEKGLNSKPLRAVDIGTGSGIIAITLAKELPEMDMHATDLSPTALAVAKRNAEQLNAGVVFHEGSFLEPLAEDAEGFDVIISNPPYIPERDRASLSDTVVHHDPEMALFAGEDGLTAYRAIIDQLSSVLKKDTLLALEIGHDQGESVPALIRDTYPQADIQTVQDINSNDRMVFAWLSE
ncbi:peptide chain release factor N(5)-glutamine methyltransferase [Pontibacillus salicampi]|uniref:Release factor glutamine methyltransferase n=1 Tax=Pontibacillus salicampi TaxID=1449801 RepID=A0ABV6LS31_9BACI